EKRARPLSSAPTTGFAERTWFTMKISPSGLQTRCSSPSRRAGSCTTDTTYIATILSKLASGKSIACASISCRPSTLESSRRLAPGLQHRAEQGIVDIRIPPVGGLYRFDLHGLLFIAIDGPGTTIARLSPFLHEDRQKSPVVSYAADRPVRPTVYHAGPDFAL